MKNFAYFTLLVFAFAILSGCTANTPEKIIINKQPENISAENNIAGSSAEANTSKEYSVTLDPADFTDKIDNKYYPLIPGTTFVYEGIADGEKERNEVVVTNQTKIILGITAVVVIDSVFDAENDLSEQTYDWYAQDKEGSVWYLGEDSKEYDNGKVVSTKGSWEAGKDGALPGIIMKSNPEKGESWRQEYLKGSAEDMAEVIDVPVSVAANSTAYDGCVKTKDWNPLEEGIVENKYYCPDIGIVLEMMVEGGQEKTELVSVKKD